MTRAFDRDDHGYLDMDRFPDAEPDGAVGVVFEPPPPLPDSDWLAALAQAVNVPDDAAATDELLDVGADAGGDPDDDASVLLPGGHDALLADDPAADDSSASGGDWSGSDDAWSRSHDDAGGSAGTDDGHGFVAGGPDDEDGTGGSW